MGFLDRFKRKGTPHSGGKGTTREDAIVISAPNEILGVAAEYEYVARECGRRGVDWDLARQGLIPGAGGGRHYDVLTIRLKNGETREYWFDITQFFGRM